MCKTNYNFKQAVKETVEQINNFLQNKEEDKNNNAWYSQNKKAIKDLFYSTAFDNNGLILRLTVIDSMYSTNINKNNFYAIPQIADAIYRYAERDEQKLFGKLQKYTESGGADSKLNTLFDNEYGLRKDGGEGSKAISLISKYFYYHTLTCKGHEKENFGFPIFDSMAREVLFAIYIMLQLSDHPAISKSQWLHGNKLQMPEFIKVLNTVKMELDIASYDKFDAYLWRVGKLLNPRVGYNFDLSESDFKTMSIKSDGNNKLYIFGKSSDNIVENYYKMLIGHVNRYYLNEENTNCKYFVERIKKIRKEQQNKNEGKEK